MERGHGNGSKERGHFGRDHVACNLILILGRSLSFISDLHSFKHVYVYLFVCLFYIER